MGDRVGTPAGHIAGDTPLADLGPYDLCDLENAIFVRSYEQLTDEELSYGQAHSVAFVSEDVTQTCDTTFASCMDTVDACLGVRRAIPGGRELHRHRR